MQYSSQYNFSPTSHIKRQMDILLRYREHRDLVNAFLRDEQTYQELSAKRSAILAEMNAILCRETVRINGLDQPLPPAIAQKFPPGATSAVLKPGEVSREELHAVDPHTDWTDYQQLAVKLQAVNQQIDRVCDVANNRGRIIQYTADTQELSVGADVEKTKRRKYIFGFIFTCFLSGFEVARELGIDIPTGFYVAGTAVFGVLLDAWLSLNTSAIRPGTCIHTVACTLGYTTLSNDGTFETYNRLRSRKWCRCLF